MFLFFVTDSVLCFHQSRILGDDSEKRQCHDGQEQCCDKTPEEIIQLSTRPEIIFGPINYHRCGRRSLESPIDRVISNGAAGYGK